MVAPGSRAPQSRIYFTSGLGIRFASIHGA